MPRSGWQFASLLAADPGKQSLLQCIEETPGFRIAYSKDSAQATVVDPGDQVLRGISPGTHVLEIEGVAFTAQGQPVRLTRGIYRSDFFKLVVINAGTQGSTLRFTATDKWKIGPLHRRLNS